MVDYGSPFIVAISSQDTPAWLLTGLVSRIVAEVGGAPAEWPALTDAVSAAAGLAGGAEPIAPASTDGGPGGQRSCRIELRAAGGSLDVLVSSNGRRLFQASRPLLSRSDDAPL